MAKSFKELRESVVKTADKKPEKFTKPDGKVGVRMVPVDKEIVKNEDKDADYHKTLGPTKNSDEGIAALKKKHGMSHDKAVATLKRLMGEAYDEPQGQAKRMMSPLQKARMDKEKADRDSQGKLKRGRSTLSRLRDIQNKSNAMAAKPRKEEVEQVDEVLDRPGALDSYKKKAKMQSDKARNSATAKIVRGNPDISKEKETIRKREKGQDMADRTGARQFRKSIGQPYIKKEEVEYVNEKLKVSDGMGAWVDDFKKSDAPQFKGKSDKERREMAVAAYLSAKRGDKK